MQKVIIKLVRDDNKSMILSDPSWGITELNGFDSPAIELFTQKRAIGDGDIITGKRAGGKDRTFSVMLLNDKLNSFYRTQIISFFNPKYTFKVYLTYMDKELWFKGELIGFKCPNGNIFDNIEITATFYSEDPYLLSVDEFGQDIASITPMLGFPYVSILGKGFIAGKYNFQQTANIYNDGDVTTDFKAIITATGTVTNPKITKDNKYVRIVDVLISGDSYTIDFMATPPTIKKNGVNAIAKLDRLSSLSDVDLNVGDNLISFDADNGSNNMKVVLYFNKKYLGI